MPDPLGAIAIIAQTAAMVDEWNERGKDRDAWKRRNSAEFAIKDSELTRKSNQAARELGLAGSRSALEREAAGISDKRMDVASAQSLTDRSVDAATKQAEEEAASIGGRSVRDYDRFLTSIGARAGDYEDEAKAFTDPLLAGTPVSTVGGSRYGGDFAAASSALPHARDSRKAEIAAFAEAMGQSTDSLAGIDIAQSGLQAQKEKISKEAGLASSDQSLALSGIASQLTGVDKKKANLNDLLARLNYDNTQGQINTSRLMDRAAQAEGRTLVGQQFNQFPVDRVLGNVAKLDFSTPAHFPVYGTGGSGARNPYGVGTYNPKSGAGGF
jgi:hypothetical protein